MDSYRVDRIATALEELGRGISAWYGHRDLRPAYQIDDALTQALEEADSFLLCTSAESPNYPEGRYLAQEKRKALERHSRDPEFNVVNIVFGDINYVAEPFRNFPIISLGHPSIWNNPSIWNKNIRSLAALIIGG